MELEFVTRDRLGEMVNLWNRVLGNEFPMREELFDQNSFLDVNTDWRASRILLNDEGAVVGYIVAKRWQDPLDVGIGTETGWIQVLLVDPKYRNQGCGSRLLTHAEKELAGAGVNRVLLGRDTWHYFPGLPVEYKDAAEWFERKGYSSKWEEFDLICGYDEHSNGDFTVPGDVSASLAAEEDQKELLAFLKESFPGRWEYEAIQYFEKGGTGREFVLVKKDERIIGFCRINGWESPIIAQNTYWSPLVEGELGGIGPLGVAASERKNGYGLMVVKAAVAFLRKRGIRSIVIDWTGLIDFYGKLGFEVWKKYVSYEKEL
jgi:GNAT superfamily N-acetyltransferase